MLNISKINIRNYMLQASSCDSETITILLLPLLSRQNKWLHSQALLARELIGHRIHHSWIRAISYFGGHLKDAIYWKNFRTLKQVKEIISDKYAAISLTSSRKMSANFVLQLQYVLAIDDAHFENIILWFSFI